ncbi:hypothetical protein HNP84_002813 [Thermocatellispora tengchongensis]|uniref:Uncharacterized protein n=1 Tax=Thermocatellispora tengchongensis TaxID=1073253 RepID=A0A840P135_9ACTN|nr:hypothetical protein [Thermocatellispora tengchongensis]
MHQDRRVAAHIVAGPEPADVGQQANGHRITARVEDTLREQPHTTAGALPMGSALRPDGIGGLLLLIRNRVLAVTVSPRSSSGDFSSVTLFHRSAWCTG